jgi:hypothetical protein
VQATLDGGYVALAETQSSAGLGVDWLVKLSANGVPQWQEQVGCASPQGGPGDYAYGVSVQQTADGGYIVGGQAVDCGSGSTCAPLSGRSCALVEKLDPAGKLTWARVYAVSLTGTVIDQIWQTTDGGYIAAGSFTGPNQYTGVLILKLDSAGNVQWQEDFGPTSTTAAYFNSVQQTADGGYVAAGAYYTPTSGPAPTQVLAVRFGADGSLTWQHAFATLGSIGAPTDVADGTSIVQTADGGYAVAAGGMTRPSTAGTGPMAPCCSSSTPLGPCNGSTPKPAGATSTATTPAPTSARSATPCTGPAMAAMSWPAAVTWSCPAACTSFPGWQRQMPVATCCGSTSTTNRALSMARH